MPKFIAKERRLIEATQFAGPRTIGPSDTRPAAPDGVEWGRHQTTETDALLDAYVVTAHGQRAWLEPGDWVADEPDGRGHYPIKPDIFAATYEPVDLHAEPVPPVGP